MQEEKTLNELEWVRTPDINLNRKKETFKEKLVRKVTENPFVPIGKRNLYICRIVM